MSPTTKGLIYGGLGVLLLLLFVYDLFGYLSRGGIEAGENPVLEYGSTVLKFIAAISFFYSAIVSFRQTKVKAR